MYKTLGRILKICFMANGKIIFIEIPMKISLKIAPNKILSSWLIY